MKIKYKRKRLKYFLYFGMAWLVLGILTLLFNDDLRWNDYGYLALGIVHLGSYFYESRNQYLTIENGFLRKNSIFPKKIELSKVVSITSSSGNYVLKTEKKELRIDIGLFEEESLLELNRILKGLNLEPSKSILCQLILGRDTHTNKSHFLKESGFCYK